MRFGHHAAVPLPTDIPLSHTQQVRQTGPVNVESRRPPSISVRLIKTRIAPEQCQARADWFRNGVKPVQLLLLAVYAKILPKVCEYGWTSPSSMSKLGAAVVGVLSMGEYSIYSTVKRDHGSRRAVTGLLLSYRFSSALARWDEGKKVWVELRTNIRDGIRMVIEPLSGDGDGDG